MSEVPYLEEGRENNELLCPLCGNPKHDSYAQSPKADGKILLRIAFMLEQDHVGTTILFLRGIREHTLETLGKRFSITRQAMEQKCEKLAEHYPILGGMLINYARRDDATAKRHRASSTAERQSSPDLQRPPEGETPPPQVSDLRVGGREGGLQNLARVAAAAPAVRGGTSSKHPGHGGDR